MAHWCPHPMTTREDLVTCFRCGKRISPEEGYDLWNIGGRTRFTHKDCDEAEE